MEQAFVLTDSSSVSQRLMIREATSVTKISASAGARGYIAITIMPAGPGLHTIEVTVEDDADVHVIVHVESEEDTKVTQRATIGAGAKLTWHNVSIRARKLTQDLVSTIEGERGESTLDWLFLGGETDTQRLSARTAFHARFGGGEITMRGIAQQKAHLSASGMIDIGRHGGGTNTYLTQEVLMLDPTAKIDAIPGLEIKTNDVKASHSASIARVTETDLFYFAARGIDADTARNMYVEGYAKEIIERIPDEAMRETLSEALALGALSR